MLKKLPAFLFFAGILGGCNTPTCIFTDTVEINSCPAGAQVYVGGELMGCTPFVGEFDRSINHTVLLRREGYQDQVFVVATREVSPFVKFGPLVDLGYYKELEPNPTATAMKPDFLPPVPGIEVFDEMTDASLKADAMKKEGKVGDAEHSYLIASIKNFYAPEACPPCDVCKVPARIDNFDAMTNEILQADAMKRDGSISPVEHAELIRKINEKYSN